MGAAVFRGRTQEVLKPRVACYWLLRVLKDPGIESQVSPASLCAIPTPWPRGELERLLTTLKGSADRPQIGMGQARMRPPQPLTGLSKGRAQLWASAVKVLTRTRRRSPTGRELGRGILAEITQRQPQHRSVPGARTWRFAQQRTLGGSGGSGPGGTRALTARPPAPSAAQAGPQTYVPAAQGPPPRSQPRLRGASAPQPWNSQSSAEPCCELQSEPSKIERGDSAGQSAATEGRGACPGSARFPPPASKPECEDSRVQSAAEQRRGACPPGPFPWPPATLGLAGRRPVFIDVSPQGERGFAGAGPGRGRIPAQGCGSSWPCCVLGVGASSPGPEACAHGAGSLLRAALGK